MQQLRRITCLAVAFVVVACDRGQSPAIEDTKPFDQAVRTYLHKKYMDLAIGEYKQLRLSAGDTKAEAVIGMTHAAEGARVQARFRFEFEKQGDAWRVVGHEQLK